MNDIKNDIIEHFQNACGGQYPIEDIFNNLSADEILEEFVEWYNNAR